MVIDSLSRREWSQLLQTQVLPSVQGPPKGAPAPLVVAHPHLAASAAPVLPQDLPLLSSTQRGRTFPMVAHWVEEGFNSPLYPTLVFVLEGEADFRLGVTRRMVQHDKRLSRKHGSYAVQLPAHSFFIVPSGAPISDASRPHWERPRLEDARSHLLWFHVVPAGVSLHTCETHGAEHDSSRALFVGETRLLPLAEFVIEELQNRTAHSETIARHYLQAFLLHIERALSASRVPVEEERAAPPEQQRATSDGTPVNRASQYIDRRLNQKITLAELAAHVYLSPAHLCRVFRSELNTTPGAYVTQRRLEHARSLLETTDLPIQRIAVLCGYPNAQHFNHAFRRNVGVSPGEYRRTRA